MLPEDVLATRTRKRAGDGLSSAARDYALAGDGTSVRAQVETRRAAGADTVVGYPARGLELFVE